VTDGRGATLTFEVGPAKGFLGSPLTITLPEAGNTLAIEYETAPSAAAVQWLAPVQTAGKKLPFLFTQGEAILTRSWVPTQDSPGIRQTYGATIRVPSGMRAVMSADHVPPDAAEKDAQGRTAFRFSMTKAIHRICSRWPSVTSPLSPSARTPVSTRNRQWPAKLRRSSRRLIK
jgi:leukotriene-A4 hydrolase